MCPTIDLFDDTGIFGVCSPNTAEVPRYSILSFSGVAVPCALMWSICSGSMPASASVLRMQPMIGLPSGLERVRWNEFGQFAAAGDDAEDLGAARDRGFIALQHQRAGAFRHDEAVAVLRERL